jgi:zinc protease
MKKLVLVGSFLFTAVCGFSQAKLVERVTKKNASEVVIPYEKYVYPNGLTLLIHEDHSDPLVHVDVTYHVGSAREEIGKSGFAHFFEHMMFQGSDHVGDEQHFKIITEAGGTLNGTTNRDRTNYFETVPSNQLEKMLWLESDRMGFLLDAVTQKKFEVQRATVKNERGQNYDNRPYGLVQETISKNLFPYGHPYSWLTIGYVEDLNRVDVNDLKNFFLRWYGPNNAVLTVGGDVNPKDLLKMVDKYFGSIPKCPAVEPTVLPAPVIDKDRYATLQDNYAKLPQLYCALPSVPFYHPDEAALDCLADILGGSNSSILYQNLVKTQKATRISCFNSTDELAGTFQFSVMPKSGGRLADMEKEIRKAIDEFMTRGVSDDDITKFKNSVEASRIYGLESVRGKVSQLAAFQTYTGDPNYIKKELARYRSFTKEDVMRVYKKYIQNKPMVILSVTTKGTESNIAAAPNYEVNTAGYKAPDYGYTGLKYVKANDFDRSKMPEAGPSPVITVPAYTSLTMKEEELKAIHAQSDELPIVVVQLSMRGGRLMEQTDLGKAGLVNLFTDMMDEDTRDRSAEEMSTALDKLGTSINFGTDLDEVNVTLRCLKKNLEPSMELLIEKLERPKFLQETFDRIKNQTLEDIKNSKTRAAVVASNAYSRLLFGNTSVLGYPSNGTSESVSKITLPDVQRYYDQYFNRSGARVVIVGDVNKKEALSILGKLTKLPKKPFESVALPKSNPISDEGRTIYLTDIPNAAQTEFRIGYETGLKYDATGNYYRCNLMNFPLGGAFNCRVNLNLREDKGWTYGARGSFNGNDYTGTYTFSSGIKSSATDSALQEITNEYIRYAEKGITEEEMRFMKKAIGQADALKYETGFQRAGFINNILKRDLPSNYTEQQNGILNSVSSSDLNKLANQWVQPSKMKIVMAGDAQKIKSPLEKLGYKIIMVDAEGSVLKP